MHNRDLDEQIAKEVMNLQGVRHGLLQVDEMYRGHWAMRLIYQPQEGNPTYEVEVPHYSGYVQDAMEMMEARFPRFSLSKSEMPDQYYAEIIFHMGMGSFETYGARALTGAVALCLAALKAARREDYETP